MKIKPEELTYNFLQQCCDTDKQIVLTNYFQADWEADILLIDALGYTHEIEIKLSKADFKNDFKKLYTHSTTGERFLKHDKISCGDYAFNSFSFLIPMGLIPQEDIPKHCGIIEFYHDQDSWETEFKTVREATKVHFTAYWDLVDKESFVRKMALNLLYKKLQLKGQDKELILKSYF